MADMPLKLPKPNEIYLINMYKQELELDNKQ